MVVSKVKQLDQSKNTVCFLPFKGQKLFCLKNKQDIKLSPQLSTLSIPFYLFIFFPNEIRCTENHERCFSNFFQGHYLQNPKSNCLIIWNNKKPSFEKTNPFIYHYLEPMASPTFSRDYCQNLCYNNHKNLRNLESIRMNKLLSNRRRQFLYEWKSDQFPNKFSC